MKYLGSKHKHAREILKIILPFRDGRPWVEPFVGGFNMIDKVGGERHANDSNEYLIALFSALQNGWNPPTRVSEGFYNIIKNNKECFPPHLVGFVGFNIAFSASFFGGYARDRRGRNYAQSGFNNLSKQRPNIININLSCGSYNEMFIPNDSLIYCDPPYRGVNRYRDVIDHDDYFDWLRLKRREGHIIFCSEYEMPDDFICVWSKTVKITANRNNTNECIRTEKLFCLP